jgi:hypothetical protein
MNLSRCLLPWGGLLVSLLSGCSSFQTEMGQPLRVQPSGFTQGQTSVQTVVATLGPPNQASELAPGFAFLYEYSRVNEFQLGVSIPISFLRYVKFLHAWNHLEQQALLLTFDEHGVLRSAGATKWKEDLGGGNALQVVVTVMSLSDVSSLMRPADAHGWGETRLDPLPVGLNSAQSLRIGQHGLQQRLAPDYAGQRTLEMAQPKTGKEQKRVKRDYQTAP